MSDNTSQPVTIPAAAASLAEVSSLLALSNRRRLQQAEDRRRMIDRVLNRATKG
jgi:hypothetical protein